MRNLTLGFVFLAFTACRSTVVASASAVTSLPATDITSHSAVLHGATDTSPEKEWFEFGITPKVQYSLDSVDGTGLATNLQPDTTYFYRYTVTKRGITCWGEIKTFTTSR